MTMPRFIVITPARNEQDNLPHTIQAMTSQTWKPATWVIVNDGSTDSTGDIIDAAAREHSWIIAIHRANRGFRKQGGGVVEAFNDGFAQVAAQAWEFVVKLDADLSFGSDFFERCLTRFESDPTLGIGGGLICHDTKGQLRAESPGDPAFHVRGATKIYRRRCWEQIGGLIAAPGWDSIDELKANMLAWTTQTFREVPITHYRYTGTADGTWKNYVKFGVANYITGYHPVFMLVKCCKRMFQRPYLVGAVGLSWGFCKGYIRRLPQVNDPGLIDYVRRQQMNKLLFRPSVW